MILIKHIEFIETDRDPMEIISMTMPFDGVEVITNEGPTVVPVSEISELIHGRRFRRINSLRPSDNMDIIVGMSKQAQDIIGIQYEAWENMEMELKNSYQSLNNLYTKLGKATLWTRIKWLFQGYK